MDVFPDLLEPELRAGKTIIDPTRFVADPSREKRFPELPYVTLRLAYVSCGFFNADLGLARSGPSIRHSIAAYSCTSRCLRRAIIPA